MSKKETRRAARQAFPPAKGGGRSKGGAAAGRGGGRGSKGRGATAQGLRPPTFKRAAIQGGIVAALYFVIIQWVWTSGAPVGVNLFFAVLGFALYTAVAYWVDKYNYKRKLRKMKGASK